MGARDTAQIVRGHLGPLLEDLVRMGLPYQACTARPEDDGDVDPLRPAVWVDDHDLCKAVVRRTPHATEGGIQACTIDVHMLNRDEMRDRMRAWLMELAPVMEQDRLIEKEGGDPVFAEPRFHSAHPVVTAAARAYGWKLEDVARPIEMGRIQAMPSARDDDGLYTAMLTNEGLRARITMSRRLLRRRVFVDTLAVTPSGGSTSENPQVVFSQNGGAHVVTITPLELPDSILASLAGRKVGDVLSGDDWTPFADQTIEHAWAGVGTGSKPSTHLRLADVQVMLDGIA